MQHNAQATCSICKSIPALLLLTRTPCGASLPRVCRHLGSRATLGCPARSRPVWPPLRRLPLLSCSAGESCSGPCHSSTHSFIHALDRQTPTDRAPMARAITAARRTSRHCTPLSGRIREPARVAAPAAGLTSDITVRGSLGASDFRINHEIRALDIPLQYM